MKKIVSTFLVITCMLTRLWGQGSGPYAAFGCEGTVLDVPAASDGIFEYANADTSSECRRVLLDTRLHIVAFLDKNDSVLHTAAVRREMMLRWFAPDPANQYWSGYVAMGNNPISYVDPDGRSTDGYIIDEKSGETAWLNNTGGSEFDVYYEGHWEGSGFQSSNSFIVENNHYSKGIDMNPIGNLIRLGVDSNVEKWGFEQYILQRGNVKLTFSEFKDIVNNAGANPRTGKPIQINESLTVTPKVHSFYSSKKYNALLGRATIYYNQNGVPVGFSDTYDFDSKNWFGQDSRTLFNEVKTRGVAGYGNVTGARPYNISYGIINR